MTRITVTLEQNEREALRARSVRERRDMRDQAALLIRDSLQWAGLIPADVPQVQTQRTGISSVNRVGVVSMSNDPIVQILIEAAARGRELRRQREEAQRVQQSDQPQADETQRDDLATVKQ